MNWIVYHIASGHAFFTGVALLIAAVLASSSIRPAVKRVSVLTFLVGVIAIAVSSTAIPYWLYALAAAITCGWIASRFKKTWHPTAAWLTIAIWLVAALFEAPHHIIPKPHAATSNQVAVIGDSVTAGIGSHDNHETWPSIIAREHLLDVQNISHVGETTASALKRVKKNSFIAQFVFIEIGGNDLLGSTSAKQFALDLEALLKYLASEDRQLMMFELPLPPFCHEYGRAQRQLAAKYKVHLVPKRIFLSVIADSDSTLDSIHLSPSGHERMADCIWSLIQPAFTNLQPFRH
ncbi:GDSL-type esterase/lipase family protein [Mariniblastus sp.]|nr:GDSL-type esterase/lipase family protein [Mariniblastus sp.]